MIKVILVPVDGTDRSADDRVCVQNDRAQGARSAADDRLFAGGFATGRKACAGRDHKEDA